MSTPPVITLMTDYGSESEFPGICHGVIRRGCPDAAIVDITHSIPRHDTRHGALVLRNARVIAYPYQENVPRMDITCYLAKESWLKANPDVARRFKRAIERATTDLINATKEVRDDWVAKYTGAKPEVVAAMNLPEFTTEFNVPSLKANLDIAVRQKLAKPFDLDTMIWKP